MARGFQDRAQTNAARGFDGCSNKRFASSVLNQPVKILKLPANAL
jgi:hypothetical protein